MKLTSRTHTIQACRTLWHSSPVFIDTETTGLDSGAEIVEISVIGCDGTVLLDTLVRPVNPIPAAAMRVHGIRNEMVAHAPPWGQVWPWVRELLSGRQVGAYNAEFDRRMLKQSNRQNGLGWEEALTSFFCVMEMYRQFGSLYRWARLEAAAQQCRIDLPNSHRAKDDALLARALFEYMAFSSD